MEKLLNMKEVATKLSISPHTVRAWVSQGRIPYVRLGRRIVLKEEDILELIRLNYVPAKR